MQAVFFYILYTFMWLLSLLPLRLLYVLSTVFYFFTYYIIRYRRKIVRKNLTNAFPRNSEKEIIKTEKKFYLHFCDSFIETIKLLHISEKEIMKRMKFTNPEIINQWLSEGKSFLFLLGHYGNWEWITSIRLHVPDKNILGGEVYKELFNKYFDKLFIKLRSQFGTVNIEMKQVYKTIVACKQENRRFAIGFIADQSPSKKNIYYWGTFLNQETAFLGGPERIAQKTGAGLLYFDVKKIKRGYYTCDIVEVCDNAQDTGEYEITELYVRLLEKTILREPAYWLWSHKRWKQKKK